MELEKFFKYALLKYRVKKALKEALIAQNEKWITIKPHGEDSEDYRRLKLEDGESPKEAIERVYGKKEKNETETIESLTTKRKQMWKDLMKKYEGNIKKIPNSEKRKYQEISEKIKALKENKTITKTPEENKNPEPIAEKKPEPQKEKETTNEKELEEKIQKQVEKARMLKEKYHNALDNPNVSEKVSDRLYQEWQTESDKVDELSEKMPMIGKTVTIDGATFKVIKYDATYSYSHGAYRLESNSGGCMTYTKNYSPEKLHQAIKDSEYAEKQKIEFRKERESMRGKNVKYEKGKIPTGKNIKEITEIAYKYDLADNIDFGKLSTFVANDMITVANDIYAEFPKVREQSKYYGSIQGRNKDILTQAVAMYSEKYYKEMRESYKDWIDDEKQELIKRRYGTMENFEKALRDKANDLIKRRYGSSRAGGEIAHSRWSPPDSTGIVYNEKFKDTKDFKYTEISKFHPEGAGTVKGVVYHEFGHQIDKYIRSKKGNNTVPYMTLKNLFNQNYARDKEKTTNELSRYGAKDFEEFIAEGFSEYKESPNPRPLATKIGELLTNAYKEIEKNG